MKNLKPVLWQKIEDQIEKYKMIDKYDCIMIALSGGSDSVVLFDFFIKNYVSHKICAAHVNHMLRGSESDDDEFFVRDLCERHGIELFVKKIDIGVLSDSLKKSVEETARNIRYEFFDECIKKTGNPTKIATAHNLSDNAETFIFNTARGTGANGIRGIPAYNGDKNIIRPLLSCSKDEILNYCNLNKLEYTQDKTNFEDIYTRNFIRLNILKKLKEKFPQIEKNIKKLNETIESDCEFIESYVNEFTKKHNITDSIDIILLKGEKTAVRYRLYRDLYERAAKYEKPELEYKHIKYIDQFIYKNENGSIDLPGGIKVYCSYGKSVFEKCGAIDHEDYSIEIEQGVNIIEAVKIKVKTEIFPYSSKLEPHITSYNSSENIYNLLNHAIIDFDKIKGTIFVKKRQNFDTYRFNKQTKNIKRNYINYKIPQRIRDRLPVFHDAEGIFLAFGLPAADRVKVDKNTKTILRIEVEIINTADGVLC